MKFHIPIIALVICSLGRPAIAEPQFISRTEALHHSHIYTGGWEHFVGGGVAIFDCNDDSLPDLFVAGGTNPATLLVNISDGDISFTPAEITQMIAVTGAYPIDIDSDGIVDLMVLRNGENQLLRGHGGCTFSDATQDFNLPSDNRWSTAFSATWEPDRDLPTLAIGNYVDLTDPNGPFGTCDTNWLIRGEGQTYDPPIALDPGFCPLSMLISDWQRTHNPMLRISNDRQYYVRDGSEQMWTLVPLRALDAADGWPLKQIWGMGIASRDISGNGMPDVMLTSMGDQVLMRNDGAQFTAVPYATGTYAQRPFTGDDGRPSTGWHAEFGDIDNDGLADLFIAKGNVDQMPGLAMQDPNNLLMQNADGTFAEAAGIAGIATTDRARGAGIADLNDDGKLDIVVVNRRAPLEVWQNTSPDAGNWIAVDPRQSGVNIYAIGAFIELRSADGRQTIERTIGGGHVSGSLIPLHFGIGKNTEAEIRVIWPDGETTPWETVTANQTVTITRATN
ncbi:CRTAC1 family protein [Loktanella sp. S4079]|uniref:CRTAC1 family protein n=1 Tax=Loktanella sp. S4079 TaxID=579483 RepID=UPI0005F9C07D|nr:CRTAC1 family protein [Loktanella sp. S4079]KJZ18376.1 ASPIC/UnbV domain-containing protein [Loktanella sp. S4079]